MELNNNHRRTFIDQIEEINKDIESIHSILERDNGEMEHQMHSYYDCKLYLLKTVKDAAILAVTDNEMDL